MSREQGEAPHASSSNPKPHVRARRRRKRDGPPQFQFLTATDPSQFKDEDAKRSVRSQAMIQYRYKSGQQKQMDKGKGKEAADAHAGEGAPRAAEHITPMMLPDGLYTYQGGQSPLMARVVDRQWGDGHNQQQQHMYHPGFVEWGAHPSRYRQVQAIVALNSVAQNVLDYEDNDAQEEFQLRVLLEKFATVTSIGDGVDPFTVLPQFSNPELDSMFLIRNCNRTFVTQTTLVKWLPVLLSHPHMLLSATLMGSTWLDMNAGKSGDSRRTMLVKEETITWINDRLWHPVQQFEDLTLIAILHLFAGEMWNCSEKALHYHQHGIAKLITHRGGMGSLQSEVTAEVAAACCYHCNIFCEATPIPLFYAWEPSKYVLIEEFAAIPESPLFCPRAEFYTILRDPRCSEYTYELLCDMRDLTRLFIDHNADLNTVLELKVEEDITRLGPSFTDYEAKVAGIRARLASLPSAYTPGHPATNDWLYESCRIAAIIYAGAIIMRTTFSAAADPSRNPIISDGVFMANSFVGGYLPATRLTEALYEALLRSNTSNVWGDMSGVLYWVAIVGAAAARTPITINMNQKDRSRSDARAIWIRRCLIMHATRPLLLLVFQHPLPIIMAQKQLLKVQELTGSGSSARILSRARS